MTFHLSISSPNGSVYQGDVASISVRGADGDLMVMAGHIPFMTTVKPCTCIIEMDNGDEKIGRVTSGLLTVGTKETVLLTSNFSWDDEQ